MLVRCRVIWHNSHFCTLFNIDPEQPDDLRVVHANRFAYMSPFAIYELNESDIDSDRNDRLKVKKIPVEWSEHISVELTRKIWGCWFGGLPELKLNLPNKRHVTPHEYAAQTSTSVMQKFHDFLSRDYGYRDCDDWLACFQHWDWSVCNYVATHPVGTHRDIYQSFCDHAWYPEILQLADSEPYATSQNAAGRVRVDGLCDHVFYVRERDARLERSLYAAYTDRRLHVRHEPVRSTPFTHKVFCGDLKNKKRRRVPFTLQLSTIDASELATLLRPYGWCGYMAIDINCESKQRTHYLIIDDHSNDITPHRVSEATINKLGCLRDNADQKPASIYIRNAHTATQADLAFLLYRVDYDTATWYIQGDGSLYAAHPTKGLLLRSLRDVATPWQPCTRNALHRSGEMCTSSFCISFSNDQSLNTADVECLHPALHKLYVVETRFTRLYAIYIRTNCYQGMHQLVYKPVKVYELPPRVFIGDIWCFGASQFPFACTVREGDEAICPYMDCKAAALCNKMYTPTGASPKPHDVPLAPMESPTLLLTLIEEHSSV